MQLPFNTPTVRGILYTLVTLSAIVVFGNAAEACDISICTARRASIVAFGVVATVIAAFAAFLTLKPLTPLLQLEFFFAVSLVILFSVLVGLASSLRTALGATYAASFAWVGHILSVLLLFGSAFAEQSIFAPAPSEEDRDEEKPTVQIEGGRVETTEASRAQAAADDVTVPQAVGATKGSADKE